jgi:hypothetical protein
MSVAIAAPRMPNSAARAAKEATFALWMIDHLPLDECGPMAFL